MLDLYVAPDYVKPDYVVDYEQPIYAISVEFNVSSGFVDVTSDALRFNCDRRLMTVFDQILPVS